MQGLTTGFRVPNQATKTMVVAAVLLQLQVLYAVFPVSVADLYCYLVIFAVLMRLLTILITQADWDPYLLLETGVCNILCGADHTTETEPTSRKINDKPSQVQSTNSKQNSKKKN